MDHNLEDSLNLDFDHAEDTVVNQEDIILEPSGHEECIPMEFEQLEDKPMLMDTGNEEIVVSDFMGDQFTLQEYCKVEHDETRLISISQAQKHPTQPIFIPASGVKEMSIMDVPASGVLTSADLSQAPKIISVQTGSSGARAIAPKTDPVVVSKAPPRQISIAPRQVAIAPKPAKAFPASIKVTQFGKQCAIAPKPGVKPVALVTNKSLAGQVTKVSQDGPSGNTVLAIGKQLVMVPGSGGQKIKLMTSGGSQLRLVTADSHKGGVGPQAGKQITKVVVQGAPSAGGEGGAARGAGRLLLTAPAGKVASHQVILGSPTKAGVRYTAMKKLVTVKSTVPSSLPQPKLGVVKKVVVSANPAQQNYVLTTTTPKTGQIAAKITHGSSAAGQKTQLHPINVPGKGVQYIRLVTNMKQANQVMNGPKSAFKSTKKIVFTDQIGNVVTVPTTPLEPPPLVVTSGAGAHAAKLAPKPPLQKLVKIAPVAAKSRGGQSLLAPLSPAAGAADVAEGAARDSALADAGDTHAEETVVEPEVDSKAALQQLIAEAVGSDDDHLADAGQDNNSSRESVSQQPTTEHSLIVIPPTAAYSMKQDLDDTNFVDGHNYTQQEDGDQSRLSGMISIEMDPYSVYRPRSPQPHNEQAESASGSGAEGGGEGEEAGRARRACNCTKSQCLKLYCDCFASGEFCHRCNCTNCHNNLQHEHLRQKAIRGCLDRNPNAFRPKIGKSKTGGQEPFRRHNKGCNCKRSGCLKNYCECYEAKIACTSICRCVGCRNMEESPERARRAPRASPRAPARAAPPSALKQPCSFMTSEVIEAVCQCMVAAAVEGGDEGEGGGGGGGAGAGGGDPIRNVIEEFARCLQDIISASHQAAPLPCYDETQS